MVQIVRPTRAELTRPIVAYGILYAEKATEELRRLRDSPF